MYNKCYWKNEFHLIKLDAKVCVLCCMCVPFAQLCALCISVYNLLIVSCIFLYFTIFLFPFWLDWICLWFIVISDSFVAFV